MNKKYLMYIFLLLVVGLISASGTYAFFEAKSTSKKIDTTSKTFEVIYRGGQSLNGPLKLGKSKEDGINTSVFISVAKNSVEALGTIYINIENMSPELSTTGFNWEVIGTKHGTQVFSNKGTFNGYNDTSNNIINIISNYKITEEETQFTVYLWLDGNKFGNEVLNSQFSGYIGARTENFTGTIS